MSVNPYSSQSIAGYNTSPPADDGSEVAANKLEWSKHKTKLGDPIKTLSEAINTAVSAAHAKGVNTDAAVRNQISGSLAFEWATATLATDAITPNASAVFVGAESGATADTLQTIETTDTYDGALLHLRARHATEEITVVHATSTLATATNPNIFLREGRNVTLSDPTQTLVLERDDNVTGGWVDIDGAQPIMPTGSVVASIGGSAPTGWVRADGRTMGNAASGGTVRANNDTEHLFKLLWDSWADAEAAVSGGRGASAVADFAADKTIVVPDLRGRLIVGRDNMGGSGANRMTTAGSGIDGDTLGKAGGTETHTLVDAELSSHEHTVGVFVAGTGASSGADRTPEGSTVNTGTTGGDTAHQNTQPSIIMNYNIKL